MSYRDKITQSVLLFCPVLKMSIFTWVWDYSTNTLTQPILSHNQQNGFYASNSFLTNILHFQYIKAWKHFKDWNVTFSFYFFCGVGWWNVWNAFPSTGKSKSKNIQWGPALHANQPKLEVLFGATPKSTSSFTHLHMEEFYTWKSFENEGLNLGQFYFGVAFFTGSTVVKICERAGLASWSKYNVKPETIINTSSSTKTKRVKKHKNMEVWEMYNYSNRPFNPRHFPICDSLCIVCKHIISNTKITFSAHFTHIILLDDMTWEITGLVWILNQLIQKYYHMTNIKMHADFCTE